MCEIKDDGLTNVCTKKNVTIKFIEIFIMAFLGASTKIHLGKKKLYKFLKLFQGL